MIDRRTALPAPLRHTLQPNTQQPSRTMSTTPPQQAPRLPSSTPVHTRSRTTDVYALKHHDRGSTIKRLSKEMSPFFIGPMPLQQFLDQFLPPSKPSCGTPRSRSPDSPPCAFETGMFSALVTASSESNLCNSFVCSRTLLFPEINPILLG